MTEAQLAERIKLAIPTFLPAQIEDGVLTGKDQGREFMVEITALEVTGA